MHCLSWLGRRYKEEVLAGQMYFLSLRGLKKNYHDLRRIELSIDGAKELDVIIRPNRVLIRQGVVKIASEKRYLFLFNDVCLVTKEHKGKVS